MGIDPVLGALATCEHEHFIHAQRRVRRHQSDESTVLPRRQQVSPVDDRLRDLAVRAFDVVAVSPEHIQLVADCRRRGSGKVHASAYRATSNSVRRSPPPPIMIRGHGRLSGRGEQRVSASW